MVGARDPCRPCSATSISRPIARRASARPAAASTTAATATTTPSLPWRGARISRIRELGDRVAGARGKNMIHRHRRRRSPTTWRNGSSSEALRRLLAHAALYPGRASTISASWSCPNCSAAACSAPSTKERRCATSRPAAAGKHSRTVRPEKGWERLLALRQAPRDQPGQAVGEALGVARPARRRARAPRRRADARRPP